MASLTVAVCTSRADALLTRCVSEVARQCSPDVTGIVVANGPSGVVEQIRHTVGDAVGARISVFHEPNLGLSHARNCALEACGTKYLAFIDDDAVPSDGWARSLLAGFGLHSAGCVGGPAHLVWPGQRPAWVTDALALYFTHLDWGSVDADLSDRLDSWLAGTNIAFAAEALRVLGGFPTSLGRRGNLLLSGEETFILERLRQTGARIWYCADALVFHNVRPERVCRRWVLSRAHWGGVSEGLRRRQDLDSQSGRRLLSIALRETVRLGMRRYSTMEWLTRIAAITGEMRVRGEEGNRCVPNQAVRILTHEARTTDTNDQDQAP